MQNLHSTQENLCRVSKAWCLDEQPASVMFGRQEIRQNSEPLCQDYKEMTQICPPAQDNFEMKSTGFFMH